MVALKTKKSVNTGMVGPMVDYAIEQMAKNPLMTIEQFEDMLYTQFHDKWNAEEGETLEGSSRLRWRNLCDWVKATLTRVEATTYVRICKVDYIVYIPRLGAVQGAGILVNRDFTIQVMRLIAAKCN